MMRLLTVSLSILCAACQDAAEALRTSAGAGPDSVVVVDLERAGDSVRYARPLVEGHQDLLVGAGDNERGGDLDPGELPPPVHVGPDPVRYLRQRRLIVPVAGVQVRDLAVGSFDEIRGGRRHDALDILAPHGTPVLAAEDGWITRLHVSDAGGNMVYTVDQSGHFVLFYAHLDRWHPRLREGMRIRRGDTLGYVGTTGNAPPNTPHLHFAILLLGEERRWWRGTPVDPYVVLAGDHPSRRRPAAQ